MDNFFKLLPKNLKLFHFYVVTKTGPTIFKVEKVDIFVTNFFGQALEHFTTIFEKTDLLYSATFTVQLKSRC